MEANSSRSIWQSIALGLIAGMRSASAPVIAMRISGQAKSNGVRNRLPGFFRSDRFNTALEAAALGELLADKLPFAPARTKPAGLAARIISGGLSGAASAKVNGSSVVLNALIGSAVAACATYLFYNLRKTISNKTGGADLKVALIEDAIVIGAGISLVKLSEKRG